MSVSIQQIDQAIVGIQAQMYNLEQQLKALITAKNLLQSSPQASEPTGGVDTKGPDNDGIRGTDEATD